MAAVCKSQISTMPLEHAQRVAHRQEGARGRACVLFEMDMAHGQHTRNSLFELHVSRGASALTCSATESTTSSAAATRTITRMVQQVCVRIVYASPLPVQLVGVEHTNQQTRTMKRRREDDDAEEVEQQEHSGSEDDVAMVGSSGDEEGLCANVCVFRVDDVHVHLCAYFVTHSLTPPRAQIPIVCARSCAR